MPQDLTMKRQTVAGAAVDAATRLYDAWQDLTRLAEINSRGVGDFADDDFAKPPNQHLTPKLVTTLLEQVVPALTAAGNAAIGETTIKAVLLQMRRG